ncbi:MAG TPA: hypothetical protein VJO99_19220, partial [Burkholderiaceae bacterium]|nr:hypothetical protein [Burkholderiaceae bacterium]
VRALPKDKAKYLVMFGLLAGALFTGIVGTLGASFVWDNGFHYALMPVHKEMESRVGKETVAAVYKAAGFVAPK